MRFITYALTSYDYARYCDSGGEAFPVGRKAIIETGATCVSQYAIDAATHSQAVYVALIVEDKERDIVIDFRRLRDDAGRVRVTL